MPVVSVAGGALRRVLICAALIVGLVGMHHLVVSACAAVAGDHGHSSAVSAVGWESVSSEHSVSLDVIPLATSGPESHPATEVSGGGATLRLALRLIILLLLLALRRPATWVTSRIREHYRMPSRAMRPRSLIEQPPDRNLLSISRT